MPFTNDIMASTLPGKKLFLLLLLFIYLFFIQAAFSRPGSAYVLQSDPFSKRSTQESSDNPPGKTSHLLLYHVIDSCDTIYFLTNSAVFK